MSRLNLIFVDESDPEPRRWTPCRVVLWTALFASLTVWIGLTLLR
jgi:hypothetical protein